MIFKSLVRYLFIVPVFLFSSLILLTPTLITVFMNLIEGPVGLYGLFFGPVIALLAGIVAVIFFLRLTHKTNTNIYFQIMVGIILLIVSAVYWLFFAQTKE